MAKGKPEIDYTLMYRVPGSETVTRRFDAKDDEEAVEKGKRYMLEEAQAGIVPDGTKLYSIYRTPENLLERVLIITEAPTRRNFCLKES